MTYLTSIDIENYCKQHSSKESTLLTTIRQEALSFAPKADMCSNSMSGGFLRILTSLKKPKHILEIGMFFGYATLCMAQGYKDADITCLESNKNVITKVKRYLKHHKIDTITIVYGDAKVTLEPTLAQKRFDFIFIDAEKCGYPYYVKTCCDHVSIGGVIVVDNALWSGKVLDPKDKQTVAIDEANKILTQDDRFDTIVLLLKTVCMFR